MEQGSTRAAEVEHGRRAFRRAFSPKHCCPGKKARGVDAVERPLGDVLRGQENNSRPGGSFGSLLRERRDERRYGEESEQGSTSVVEVAGVATPPRAAV